MARGKQVPGFCYVTGTELSMTPAEWRAKYPAPAFVREVANGETTYRKLALGQPRVAEAYAIIPEGRTDG